jgi:hypothetical protein
MGTIRTVVPKQLRADTQAMVDTRRAAHSILAAQARRTGLTCRWSGQNVEGYIKGLRMWVTVYRSW